MINFFSKVQNCIFNNFYERMNYYDLMKQTQKDYNINIFDYKVIEKTIYFKSIA